MGPEVGEKEVIVGGVVGIVFRKTESELLPLFATANSGFPSPSKSPMAIVVGPVPVVKSIFAAKEFAVMEPDVLMFLRTDTELLL